MEKLVNLKARFRVLERNVLILTGLPLPAFAFAYLHTNSPNMELNLPELPVLLGTVLLSLVIAFLVLQWFNFHQGIKKVRKSEISLEEKVDRYSVLTMQRFYKLFFIGFACAIGLLFYDSAGFTIAYAVTLVYVSLGKPTPDRIAKLLRLKGEEKDLIYAINQRE
ncbi:hypothetical protein KIH41_09680 [Litoribacter ruber]|uniref:Uncharacterized protein n=1 Tax=Litoribacter ruber TaxID=702568 RepID=A0AAP2CHR8_9BACT|nr:MULTISPECIES: hypothetical protein [Litoribacter]MBS9523859.1 hypothetical protein [Litoribacter alkaliphilus]MBT0811547.1 hypothetical protein [Litoribacter ruber]